jgi:predicted chitinase
MNREKFFEFIKRPTSGLFGARLSQPQVDGINSILDACEKYNITNPHHVAHILANVYHETGRYMSPIKETVYGSSFNKDPNDSIVIKRLDTAFAKGQLPWVKTPYWRDGWFGRGQIQITHKNNYVKMGKKIGVDLVSNPSLALDLKNSAAIAVLGMRDGEFTGKKLSDYKFPEALDNKWENHPRRIVNGKDGTDDKIKKYHLGFYAALMFADFTAPSKPVLDKKPVSVVTPKDSKQSMLQALITVIKTLFGKK